MPYKDPTDRTRAAQAFTRLVEIMARLRNPEGGCPWDIEQTFRTIYPYTLEEAYEVADAIERDDMADLREELGDLLFQVMFHSQMAAEDDYFTVTEVVEGISEKMRRRHPHVFGKNDNRSAQEQTKAWEAIKAAERASKAKTPTHPSALDGVALTLPALLRAEKLQKRAARVGFDWVEPEPIFEKLEEETQEVRDAMAAGDQAAIAEEVGDLLFVVANLARRLKVDPEDALRQANLKFENRFKHMEAKSMAQGQNFATLSLNEQEALWIAVKADEKRG